MLSCHFRGVVDDCVCFLHWASVSADRGVWNFVHLMIDAVLIHLNSASRWRA
jgi:hypothetical protein